MKRKKDYESPAALGDASKALATTVHHFLDHFWCKFGHQDARSLAEARHAEVCVFWLMFLFLSLL